MLTEVTDDLIHVRNSCIEGDDVSIFSQSTCDFNAPRCIGKTYETNNRVIPNQRKATLRRKNSLL